MRGSLFPFHAREMFHTVDVLEFASPSSRGKVIWVDLDRFKLGGNYKGAVNVPVRGLWGHRFFNSSDFYCVFVCV